MTTRREVLAQVARDAALRRVLVGFGGFAVAEHGTWLASIMYAYDRGGVGEAAIAAVVLLTPALLIAPLASFTADRFESHRVLAIGYAIQSAAMAVTAVAIAGDAPALLVYAGAMAASSGVTLTRPAMGVVLPHTTHTPADLTAANVVMGFVEYSGMFLGPALTGVLASVSGLAAPFAVCSALTAVAAVLAIGIRTHDRFDAHDADDEGGDGYEPTVRGAIDDVVDGLRALRTHRSVLMMIAMLSLGSLVIGAADVLFVATADHLNDGDTSQAGLFGTAFGIGAVAGSALTVVLVGRRRLTPFIASAVAAMGIGLAALSAAGMAVTAAALYAVMGGGESVLRVSASTLIQRIAPSGLVGRFFGVAEGIHMFSIAIGSGVIGLLVSTAGYESGLLAAGVAVPILLLLRITPLLRIDRDAVTPDDDVLALILGDEILAPLPAPVVERLAADATRRHHEPGDHITVEGRPGDHYFVIGRGEVAITIDGRPIRTLGPGRGFGELALLHAVPRTATATAVTDVDLLAFSRDEFLQAVTGQRPSRAAWRTRASGYVDAPDRRPGS